MTDLKRWAASFHFLNLASTLTYICQLLLKSRCIEFWKPTILKGKKVHQHLINIGFETVHYSEKVAERRQSVDMSHEQNPH